MELFLSSDRTSSGFSYPVPWYLIPFNVFIIIYAIFSFITSPIVKAINRSRTESGIPGPLPLLETYAKDRYHLSPGLPEIDYPVETVPSNVIGCGPIIVRAVPVSDIDPELAVWLKQQPTILINLGSHVVSQNTDARQLASGLRVVLDQHQDLQVLWKLKLQGPLDEEIAQTLATELSSDRVRITSWLKADPAAILETGDIVCSVHHGGANSWFEAIKYVPYPTLLLFHRTPFLHEPKSPLSFPINRLTNPAQPSSCPDSESPTSSFPSGTTLTAMPTAPNTSASDSTETVAWLLTSTPKRSVAP